jgi:hypothetical protein
MTNKVVAKYPIKIGKVLVPKGTVGTIPTLDEVKIIWPTIEYKENSKQLPVKFLGLSICIVHTSQVIILE